ncbi:MAG: glycosyltransferase [Thermoleophilia bacterium]|nr:glycosyltransferase [Thermoleophilia bacterium]
MSRVVITLPAYRAERTLARTLADIPPRFADDVILVDDGSPDGTVELARELGIRRVYAHRSNRGYGANQKTCYTKALDDGAGVVVLLHPDYQYDPKALPKLIEPILAGEADMAFGSRFAADGDPRAGGMPRYRYYGNRITTTLENAMLGSHFTDLHSGMRAFTREFLLSLPFRAYSDDFDFDSQLIVDASTGGHRVVEVPIPTRYTSDSSSIGIARSLRYVASTLAHAARQSASRGRGGRRWPPAWRELRAGPALAGGPPVERACVLCGAREHELVHASTAAGAVEPGEFRCTSDALSRHDDIVQCRTCGMVSSLPPLAPGAVLETYEQVVDETYLSEEESRRELFAWVLASIEAYHLRGRRLLELGANVGLFLDTARARSWDAAGYEPSRWAVGVGRRRFGVDLRQGALEDFAASRERADAVVLLDVLEHVVEPVAALRRLRDAVDDEGLLTLTTINVASIHARLRKSSWPWFIRPHLHYFTPETLHAALRAARFRPVEFTLVPRAFRLSYIAGRLTRASPVLARTALRATEVRDVRVPVGWLGDIVLVHARPA